MSEDCKAILVFDKVKQCCWEFVLPAAICLCSMPFPILFWKQVTFQIFVTDLALRLKLYSSIVVAFTYFEVAEQI